MSCEAALHAVDVGFGDALTTTEELLVALRSAYPHCEVAITAIDNDPERVARACRENRETQLRVQLGGFEAVKSVWPQPHLIRVMNVLRGYPEQEARSAQHALFDALRPHGLLVEGSTDKAGHLLAAHVWQKSEHSGKQYVGLAIASDFARGFAPRMFRDVLPRDLRRHVVRGEPVADWLLAWQDIVERLRGAPVSASEPRAEPLRDNALLFQASAQILAEEVGCTDARLAKKGTILWTPTSPSGHLHVLSAERRPQLER